MNKSITIGDIQKSLTQFLSKQIVSKIAVIVDENTEKYCLPIVADIIGDVKVIKIVSGEENKNLTTCQNIWNSLTKHNFDRHGLIINLGGGVIGDMGGFCAATYKRGLSFINIPTTLLSMVDASVGGKLGIDFGSYKNHIGLFQTPNHVFIDPKFLTTLPEKELKSGYGEVIKHALITSEDDWSQLHTSDFDAINWTAIIEKSVAIKSEIVAQDFKESGVRKTLNFGHTIGHAIESYFLEQGSESKILHGEGVAIGMICECYISTLKLDFPKQALHEIEKYIIEVFKPVKIPEDANSKIVMLCGQDKKNARNKIQAVLLKSIGTPITDSEITTEDILGALRYYSGLNI